MHQKLWNKNTRCLQRGCADAGVGIGNKKCCDQDVTAYTDSLLKKTAPIFCFLAALAPMGEQLFLNVPLPGIFFMDFCVFHPNKASQPVFIPYWQIANNVLLLFYMKFFKNAIINQIPCKNRAERIVPPFLWQGFCLIYTFFCHWGCPASNLFFWRYPLLPGYGHIHAERPGFIKKPGLFMFYRV